MNHFERFADDFSFRIAISEQDRNRIYATRHEVYCQEFNYDMGEDKVRQLEKDIYDDAALLCFIEHKRSGMTAGCLRLLMPLDGQPAPLGKLQLENHFGASLNHPLLHPAKLPRDRICELSRMAIPRYFRCHGNMSKTALDRDVLLFSDDDARSFPLINLGLFLAATALVGLAERYHVFMFMVPQFPRLAARYGFTFSRVGEMLDFHGRRAAFHIDYRHTVPNMHANLSRLYHHIQQELAAQYDDVIANPPLWLAKPSTPCLI
ncbi:PEP-CTERM/exosortase system-associated acyltransferase [Phytohalomonas tamaricis]|uniref:PEP-CTERM/exosortase system-associated acyltransferase n=1 Tax=Phytohalomonas tamaricis TaxID=2081032 RepID=UPI000D0B507E|nr:PEP-CTERM/exosortase system-associated acyltransferase [Phytohalomonas tamaricis]